MTSLVNRAACSPEYLAAFAAVEAGSAVARRESWPAGVFIKRRDDGCIGVVRPGCEMAPVWQGPSNTESDATDWFVL
jgi:hypothetical protein